MNKEFDFIVFSATSFTGDLVRKYLSAHADACNLKWEISRRDEKS